MASIEQIMATVQAVYMWTVMIYKQLHQIPELRWEEEKTLALIQDRVGVLAEEAEKQRINISIWPNFTGGLVVDVIPNFCNLSRGFLLLRADVDALKFEDKDGKPLNEATGLPWASTHPGLMHACFHDAHAAMLLGLLKAIANGMVKINRPLRLVWQRAEENPITESGGARLVGEGVKDDVTRFYAQHLDPRYPVGTVISLPGSMLGNSDRLKTIFRYHGDDRLTTERIYRVVIKSSGGHVARTGNSDVNALRVAQQIYNLLGVHGIYSQLVTLQGGMASNTMPQEAVLDFWAPNETLAGLGSLIRRFDTLLGANIFEVTHRDWKDKTFRPHTAALLQAMNMLADFPVRTLGPVEPATLEPCIVRPTDVPGELECWWAVRTMLSPPEVRDEYMNQIMNVIMNAGSTFPDVSVECDPRYGHPALYNSPRAVERVENLAEQAGYTYVEGKPVLGGEDFAHYLHGEDDGVFTFIGCGLESSGGFHTLTAQPDLQTLAVGLTMLLMQATAWE